MLRTVALGMMVVGLLIAVAGLIVERRAGRLPRRTFIVLMAAVLLGATGAALALIGTTLDQSAALLAA